MQNRKIVITNLKEFFTSTPLFHFGILGTLETIICKQDVPETRIQVDDSVFIFKGSNFTGAIPVFFYEFQNE